MGYDERHSESNTGWLVANWSPNWTPRTGSFSGWPFDWLPCPPRGSDLGFELIMEPNSCCYDPINKNHFYSRFFFSLFWPLLSTCLPTDCALGPPPLPHIQTLRSCFKLLGLKTSLTTWTSIVAIQEAHHTKRFDKLHATATTPLTANGTGSLCSKQMHKKDLNSYCKLKHFTYGGCQDDELVVWKRRKRSHILCHYSFLS